jgi:hypothetical protein
MILIFKIEIIMSKPILYIFHDVLTDNEIKKFQEESLEKVKILLEIHVTVSLSSLVFQVARSGVYDAKNPNQFKVIKVLHFSKMILNSKN